HAPGRRGWRRQRNVHVAEILVRGHRVPRTEVTGNLPGLVAPRLDAEFSGPWHDVKRPEQPAAPRVEAPDILERRLFLQRTRVARARRVTGHHHDIADDERAGGVVEACGERLVLLEMKACASLVAESRNRFAGPSVQRVQVLAANGKDS